MFKLSLFLFLCSWPALLALQIPDSCEIITLYREMNCTPNFDQGSKCPVEYECDHFIKFNPKVCYYNGKVYAKGEELKEEDSVDTCRFHCKCMSSWPKVGNAAWTCASGECFGDTFIPGCVNQYRDLKSCCRNRTYCEKTDTKSIHKCTYKGETYVEGQLIYDDEKCKRCICDANFSEKLEGPSCQYQSCGMMLDSVTYLRDGCVPVYYGRSHCSCPIEYKCPDSTDAITQSTKELNSVPVSKRSCKFGDLTMKVGDRLVKKENESYECSCETPPFMTCVKKPDSKN